MESLCQRFPHVIELILDNLDDKNLVNYREASREMSEFLPKERFYWIRIIKHFSAYFGSFKSSWKQAINKTSVEIIKKLALEVQQFFADRDRYLETFSSEEKLLNIKNIAPLHIAAEQGNLKLCVHILEKTEDKNPMGDMQLIYETSPLHIAAMNGNFEICSLIMGHIDVNELFKIELDTPLHEAAEAGHFKTFKVIMDLVKEKNPPDAFGLTPLHIAAQKNHLEICKLIISNVKNIHTKDDLEKTPKDYAIENNNLEIVRLFEYYIV